MREIDLEPGTHVVILSDYELVSLRQALEGPEGLASVIKSKIEEFEEGREESRRRARDADVRGDMKAYDAWTRSEIMIHQPNIDLLNRILREAAGESAV